MGPVTAVKRNKQACLLLSCLLAFGRLHAQQSASECQNRLARANRESEKTPMPLRFRPILKGFSGNIECIPEELRIAAGKAAGTRDMKEYSELLFAAARPYLPPDAVHSGSPGPRSSTLSQGAPLQGVLVDFELLYDCIDEGTYAFAWVVQRKLIESGSYKSDGGERLLMNLLLSVVKNACPGGPP